MNIQFLEDEDTWVAIVVDCVFRKQHCEELWYAEISRKKDCYEVFWEEDFKTKYPFDSLEEAKGFIKLNYTTKTPLIMGKRTDI